MLGSWVWISMAACVQGGAESSLLGLQLKAKWFYFKKAHVLVAPLWLWKPVAGWLLRQLVELSIVVKENLS